MDKMLLFKSDDPNSSSARIASPSYERNSGSANRCGFVVDGKGAKGCCSCIQDMEIDKSLTESHEDEVSIQVFTVFSFTCLFVCLSRFAALPGISS